MSESARLYDAGSIDHESYGHEHDPLLDSESFKPINYSINGEEQDSEREHTTAEKGTTWYMAMFLVVNAALGAGILDFPYAYHQAGGVMVGILTQAVLLTFIIAALVLLAYCSDLNNAASYQDTMTSLLGVKGQVVCAATVAVYCFGTCITFLVIIGDQLDRFFFYVYGPDFCEHWYMKRTYTITLSSIALILPLCFPKRIDFLKYASFLGVLAVFYVIGLVIGEYYKLNGGQPAPGVRTEPDNWTDIFLVVPTITFGYQCHVSVIPIYSCLEQRNLKNFGKTITGALIIVVATYTFVAVFGYWTFGQDIKPDVLESYNPDTEVLAGILLIAFKTYTTYPILLFCGRAALEDIYKVARHLTTEQAERGEKPRRFITVVVWFALTLVTALVVPNIDMVIAVLGAFAAIFIFIYPGLCLIKAVDRLAPTPSRTRDRMLWGGAVAFMALGAFLFGVTVVQCVQKDMAFGRQHPSVPKHTCD